MTRAFIGAICRGSFEEQLPFLQNLDKRCRQSSYRGLYLPSTSEDGVMAFRHLLFGAVAGVLGGMYIAQNYEVWDTFKVARDRPREICCWPQSNFCCRFQRWEQCSGSGCQWQRRRKRSAVGTGSWRRRRIGLVVRKVRKCVNGLPLNGTFQDKCGAMVSNSIQVSNVYFFVTIFWQPLSREFV